MPTVGKNADSMQRVFPRRLFPDSGRGLEHLECALLFRTGSPVRIYATGRLPLGILF